MGNLDFFIHDGSDALRLKVLGDLCGPGVASLDQAWRTARSTLRGRLLIIDLVSVSDADEYGRDLLLCWHRIGAKIVARSRESHAFAEKIIGLPIQMLAPKSCWRARLSEFFFWWSTAAASKPAQSATTKLNLSAINHIGRRLSAAIVGAAKPCDQAK
jgi:hypothetical protein